MVLPLTKARIMKHEAKLAALFIQITCQQLQYVVSWRSSGGHRRHRRRAAQLFRVYCGPPDEAAGRRARSDSDAASRVLHDHATFESGPTQQSDARDSELTCPSRYAVRDIGSIGSGGLASSRDVLRADSDLRAYRPCHRRCLAVRICGYGLQLL